MVLFRNQKYNPEENGEGTAGIRLVSALAYAFSWLQLPFEGGRAVGDERSGRDDRANPRPFFMATGKGIDFRLVPFKPIPKRLALKRTHRHTNMLFRGGLPLKSTTNHAPFCLWLHVCDTYTRLAAQLANDAPLRVRRAASLSVFKSSTLHSTRLYVQTLRCMAVSR